MPSVKKITNMFLMFDFTCFASFRYGEEMLIYSGDWCLVTEL